MPSALHLVRTNLESTRAQWKQNHIEAMQYWEFVEFVRLMLEAYDRTCRLDEAIRAAVYAKSEPYDELQDALLENVYREWLDLAEQIQDDACKIEVQYDNVDEITRLRDCVEEVRGILTPDNEFFADDKLVEARDRAVDELRIGDRDEPAGNESTDLGV